MVGADGKQLGIFPLNEALQMARAQGVDLVEVAPNANPPVCRLVDYGKYRFEQAKREKESRKHQHASVVKEVQLSPRIDPHDLNIKLARAIDFLCDDFKVKFTLKFRGREMAHTEFGFEVINKALAQVAPYGHPDFEPKLVGRGITVMVSPLPRNKRAKNPRELAPGETPTAPAPNNHNVAVKPTAPAIAPAVVRNDVPANTPSRSQPAAGGFVNNPFTQLEVKPPG